MRVKRKIRNRRHRRTGTQLMRFGRSAKATHEGKSGRTGKMHSVKLRSRQPERAKETNR